MRRSLFFLDVNARLQNIVPIVKNAHYLLVTLLLCNAAAMEVRHGIQAEAHLQATRLDCHTFSRASGSLFSSRLSAAMCNVPVFHSRVLCSTLTSCVPFFLLALLALCAQALPIFLDKMVHEIAAVAISVTAVLLFGEPVHSQH